VTLANVEAGVIGATPPGRADKDKDGSIKRLMESVPVQIAWMGLEHVRSLHKAQWGGGQVSLRYSVSGVEEGALLAQAMSALGELQGAVMRGEGGAREAQQCAGSCL
jgi:hypothetical protein